MIEDDRIAKLEEKVGEQWLLIDILLNRSGLDTAGIERAHQYAEDTWKNIMDTMAKRASDKYLSTPEGQETHRIMEEEMHQRRREFWREDCVEAGRILPDPTAS
jgi:hypothetical protein